MPTNERYRLEGVAHIVIFAAFNVLLLNSVLLWGRGYDVRFDLWGLFTENTLRWRLYSAAKEVTAAFCVLGAGIFVYARTVRKLRRMTLGVEGLIILGIIITMMLADFLYVGARNALVHHPGSGVTWRWWEPVGSALSRFRQPLAPDADRPARPLIREADLHVMLVVMKAGSVIKDHSAKETASVYTVSGHLRVRLPTGVVDMPSARLLVLERGLVHSVEAVEESTFLLSRGSHEKP